MFLQQWKKNLNKALNSYFQVITILKRTYFRDREAEPFKSCLCLATEQETKKCNKESEKERQKERKKK